MLKKLLCKYDIRLVKSHIFYFRKIKSAFFVIFRPFMTIQTTQLCRYDGLNLRHQRPCLLDVSSINLCTPVWNAPKIQNAAYIWPYILILSVSNRLIYQLNMVLIIISNHMLHNDVLKCAPKKSQKFPRAMKTADSVRFTYYHWTQIIPINTPWGYMCNRLKLLGYIASPHPKSPNKQTLPISLFKNKTSTG